MRCMLQVMASVDSEAGGILTSVTPKQSLCDGQWHSVAGMAYGSLFTETVSLFISLECPKRSLRS